jgi:pyridoxal phosphate enzyme (YggS family)
MIAERLGAVRARIDRACAAAGRDPTDVALLAVSKFHPVEAILAAYDAGQRRFGENYVQEWLAKAEDPRLLRCPDLRWRFIGHLQRNKVRFVLGRVEAVETVDSVRLARALGERAAERGAAQAVLLQVRIGDEASKAGVSPEAGALLAALPPGLDVRGLMSIPPPRDDPEASRADHRALRRLRDRLQDASGVPLPELSMGMSDDLEVAIEEGSTEVRVGTAIFGPRPA